MQAAYSGTTYTGRQFHHLRRLNAPGVFSGITVKNCEFFGCVFGDQSDASRPVRVTDTTVTGSKFINNSVVGVQFEDVTITNSTTGTPMALEGCLFRNVVLRGRLGTWIVNGLWHPSYPETTRSAFARSELEFYAGLRAAGEFALDISEAKFRSGDLFHLPGDLIRRNPESQFLAHKKHVEHADLSALSGTQQRLLKRVVKNQHDSTVLVAGRMRADFAARLADLRQLVDLGLATA
ncbi:hypothetical protein [Amycolatopsis sp. NPDC054798]